MRAGSNLIRSLVFWAGLLGILFITWTASHSRYRSVNWSYIIGPNFRISITSSGQCIHVIQTSIRGGGYTAGGSRGSIMMVPRQPEPDEWFSAVDFRREFRPAPIPKLAARGMGTESTFVTVPYWLALVLIIPAWLFLSFWRARRIGRMRSGRQADPVRTPA